MNIHLLCGDSLAKPFHSTGIEGEVKICRECFVDGDLKSEGLEDFWEKREKYLTTAYNGETPKYVTDIRDEFIALWNLADVKENSVNLWFERELFCQVNMWFSIWLLRTTETDFFVVYPRLENDDDKWKGFSQLDHEGLKASFEKREKLSYGDVYLAVELWEAFEKRDFEKLTALGKTESEAFPTLKEVCEAAVQIETRPKDSLKKIIAEGAQDFTSAFKAFSETEAVYGFGDLYVKRIYDSLK